METVFVLMMLVPARSKEVGELSREMKHFVGCHAEQPANFMIVDEAMEKRREGFKTYGKSVKVSCSDGALAAFFRIILASWKDMMSEKA